MSDGACQLCEECLSRKGVVSVVTKGGKCWKCGHTPEVVFTRREIKACLK